MDLWLEKRSSPKRESKSSWVLSRGGYSVTDSCRGIGIARSTYYKWTDEYPDLNKAVCEATDLQWKYGYDVLRRRKKRDYARQLNRPSVNYQSPGNMPFEIPIVS